MTYSNVPDHGPASKEILEAATLIGVDYTCFVVGDRVTVHAVPGFLLCDRTGVVTESVPGRVEILLDAHVSSVSCKASIRT